MYAAPARVPCVASSLEPTIAYCPSADTDTENPKSSSAAALLAYNICCSFQVVPDLTNVYAAPALLPCVSSDGAPIMIYNPSADIAADCPKLADAETLLAFNIFCSVQVVPDLINTYTAPAPLPPVSSPLAPTAAY